MARITKAQLEAQVAELQAQLAVAQRQVAELEAINGMKRDRTEHAARPTAREAISAALEAARTQAHAPRTWQEQRARAMRAARAQAMASGRVARAAFH